MALRYARARLGRYGVEDAAQDVAQEVCVAVLTALPTFDDRGLPFEAFVYSIAARKVADAQRRVMRSAAPMANVPEHADEQASPEDLALLRDDAGQVIALLASLLLPSARSSSSAWPWACRPRRPRPPWA